MRQRSRFARWISIALIIGLVVTCMPVTSALAEVQPTQIANESDGNEGQPQIRNGQPQGNEEGEAQDNTVQRVEDVELEPQQTDERILELNAEMFFSTTADSSLLPAILAQCKNNDGETVSVPVSSEAENEAYLVFRNSGSNSETFQTLLGLGLENVVSVTLEFNVNEEEGSEYTFNAYPLDIRQNALLHNIELHPLISGGLAFDGNIWGTTRSTESRDGTYSIEQKNMENNTSILTSAQLNGIMGFALRLTSGDATISSREKAAKLVIKYMESAEEAEPSLEAIKAADDMLQAREAVQLSLEGSGTVSDPYLIYDADDLSGMTENDNACYKLMKDIDLKGINWRPVGYYYWYPFMGYLDGNGYTIKNLHVGGTGNDAWDINAGGLFGYLEGRVENLHVETVKAKRKGVDFFGYAGGIAGVANAPAEIINCSVNGYISGNNCAGGLVGIAYPGVIIENCCAIGSVDMSDAFAYINDNGLELVNELWNNGMDIGIYIIQFLCIGDEIKASKENKTKAVFDAVWNKIVDFPLDAIANTSVQQGLRNCSLGGLVGMNFGTIKNSYASVDLYNPQNQATQLMDMDGDDNVNGISDWLLSNRMAKTGGLVGRNIAGYGTTSNCFFNGERYNNVNNSGQGTEKTTAELKNVNLFGKNGSAEWNYDKKLKSADGLPLPVCNYVDRNMKGDYQPDVYYDSRVLMKTRESFFLGTETEDGSLICSKCVELKKELEKKETEAEKAPIRKQIAVTGIYQRGSDARPYHVHDLDSLLAMQDNKESHFILCCDIDFKVSNGNGKTVQKYWWPAGKTHFSPIKGSLKGNTSCNSDTYIYEAGEIKPLLVENKANRFTIKNLTVQSNRHAGLFASFRGTFSDINIQLSDIGISTIGKKASAGAVAGETVNGALIRSCIVTGPKNDGTIPSNARIRGSVRSGGITGMNNRGSKIEGCEVLVDINADQYEVDYIIDWAGTAMDIYKALLAQADALIDEIESIINCNDEEGFKKYLQWFSLFEKGVMVIVDGPFMQYIRSRYIDVCIGGLVGDNFGTIGKNCIYYTQSKLNRGAWFSGYAWHCGETVGRNNYFSSTNKAAEESYEATTVSAFSAASAFAAQSDSMPTAALAGAGSEISPMVVSSEADLKVLAAAIQQNGLEGTHIKQTRDIILPDDSDFKGFLGTFKGVYDGNGCTISGIAAERELFEKTDGATIKNLGIKNSSFSAKAAFVGSLKNSTLQNCWLERTVHVGNENINYVAGFANVAENSAIYNVYNYARMKAKFDVCGIAIETKGESCVASCFIDMKKEAMNAGNLAIANTIGKDSSCLNCLWRPSETMGKAKDDRRSTDKSSVDGCRALTQAQFSVNKVFELADYLDNNTQDTQTALNKDIEEGYELSFADEAFWTVGFDETGLFPTLAFFGMKYEGRGTATSPYLLKDSQDFDYFAEQRAAGDEMEDVYFKQMADITVSDEANADLAEASKIAFKGSYDGAYHTLSGIMIDNRKENDGTTNAALFGEIEGASIKNLGIAASSFKAGTAAPFVAKGNSRIVFDEEELTSSQQRNLIQNCWTEDDVEIVGSLVSGGIAGSLALSDIYYCANYGTIDGSNSGGGIANSVSEGKIVGCISAGEMRTNVARSFASLTESTCDDSFAVSETGSGENEITIQGLRSAEFVSELNLNAAASGIEGLGTWIAREGSNPRPTAVPIPYSAVIDTQDNGESETVQIEGLNFAVSRLASINSTNSLPNQEDSKDFSSGSGTKLNPYEIRTIEELARIKHYLKDGFYFRLMNDLDFANYDGNWVAIGTDPDYFAFQGVFDGNGYTIKNLNMSSSATAGLFGYCAGTVKNLKVENFNIDTTGLSAGAIVGELCAGGRVEQCAVINSVIDSAHYSGGIVGAAYKGAVINNVYANDVSCYLSAILALNGGEEALLGGGRDSSFGSGFTDSWSVILEILDEVENLCDLLRLPDLKGGISYAQGIIKKWGDGDSAARTAAAGGIVGFLGGTLGNSWVKRNSNAVAEAVSSLTAGLLSAYEGESVGRRFYGSVVGKNKSVNVPGLKAVGSDDNGKLSNKNYTVVNTAKDILMAVDSTWDGSELRVFGDGKRGLSGVESVFDLEKELSAIEPNKGNDGYYQITNVSELVYVEFAPGSKYRLMNDIDLSGYNWVPICRERDQSFEGVFDGNGYTIYGLHVETSENGGLFGFILGTVKNLNIGVDVVDAYGSAGALAAGVFYPARISAVSAVDNDIAIAIIAERELQDKASRTAATEKDPLNADGILRSFLELQAGVAEWDPDMTFGDAEDIFKRFYEARKSNPAASTKKHIIGGGNDDGAGVGGLIGIVGKDVTIKDCYTRVNVSNANFVLVKEFDLCGMWLEVADRFMEAFNDIAGGVRKNKQINGNIETFNSDIAALSMKLYFWERRIEICKQHKERAQASLESLEKSLPDEANKYTQATEEIRKINEDIAEKEKENSGLRSELEKEKDSAKKAELEEKIKNNEKTIGKYKEKRKKEEKEVDKIKRKNESIKTAKTAYKEENAIQAECEKEKKDVEDNINSYNDKISAVNNYQKNVRLVATMKAIKHLVSAYNDIRNSFYDSCVGGLVGECRGELVNCYSIGELTADFSDAKSGGWKILSFIACSLHEGRLVGRVRTGQSVSRTGKISSASKLVSNCYYHGGKIVGHKKQDGKLIPVIEGEGFGNPCPDLTKMQSADTYDGFDFSKKWKMGEFSLFPELVTQFDTEYMESAFARNMKPFGQGDGTEEDPYIVDSEADFLRIAEYRKEEYYYKLACDIDLTPGNGNGNHVNSCIDLSTDFFGGIGYGVATGVLAGSAVDLDFDGDAFAGHFDGNGYKIRYTEKVWSKEDIEKKDPYYYACGLFPVLSGSIENLELECTGIAPKARYRGLIAGRMLAGSRVENVRVSYQGSATLVAQVAVGGMVGSVEKGAYIGNCVLDAPNLDFSVEKESIFLSERIASIIGENGGTAEYLIARTGHDGAVRANTLTGGVSHELWHGKSDGFSTYANGQFSLPGAATERDWVNRGFDFNNTWTMDDAKPTLRCLRSTNKYQYDWKLRVKACEAINAKEITMTDSDIYKHQGEQASISGIGTESSPFAISSPKDFMAMMYAISGAGDAAGRSYSGVYFEQTEDICLDLKELAGIKYTKNNVETSILGDGVFGGNYDGNGHIIELTDTGSGIGLPKLFKSLSGATFRNCIFIAPKNQEGQTSILLAEKASNSLFLNCDLIKVNKLADSMSDVSMLNNLYENPAVFYGIVKSDCFNGRIVGLEDAAEAAFTNNKETVDNYNAKITMDACAELNLMTGLPEEIKKMAYAWSSDGLRYRPSTDAYETVNFDLGEGVEIDDIQTLTYKDESQGELLPARELEQDDYIFDGTKIVGVRVPKSSKLKINFSYSGDASDREYVLLTDCADTANRIEKASKRDLKDLIYGLWLAASTGNISSSESTEQAELLVYESGEAIGSTGTVVPEEIARIEISSAMRAGVKAYIDSSNVVFITIPKGTTVVTGDSTEVLLQDGGIMRADNGAVISEILSFEAGSTFSVGDMEFTVPNGFTVSIPAGQIGYVSRDANSIELPAGSIIQRRTDIVSSEGRISLKDDGTVITLKCDAEVTVNNVTVKLPAGVESVTLPSDKIGELAADEAGVVYLPADSHVNNAGNTILSKVEEDERTTLRVKDFGDMDEKAYTSLAEGSSTGGMLIGTLPADTSYTCYTVMEGEQTLSLYKKSSPYKAVVVTDKPYQGAQIEKVRFYFTPRLYEEVAAEPSYLKITGFDSQSLCKQTVTVARRFISGADPVEFETFVQLRENASWNNASEVALKKLPDKLYYLPGEKIDLSGAVVTLTGPSVGMQRDVPIEEAFVLDEDGNESQYCLSEDGEHDAVHLISLMTPEQYAPEDLDTPQQTVRLSILKREFSFDIQLVKVLPVRSIDIVEVPEKTNYVVGDDMIDLTGGSLRITYEDGSVSQILSLKDANVEYTIGEIDEDGNAVITITYGGCSDSFVVSFSERSIEGISMSVYPTITGHHSRSYTEDCIIESGAGENKSYDYNFGNGEITIRYNNGNSEKKSFAEIEEEADSDTYIRYSKYGYLSANQMAEQRTCTVKYRGAEVSFDFYVYKPIQSITYVADSLGEQYRGDALSLTGGQLELVYSSHSGTQSRRVNLNDSKVSLSYEGTDDDGKLNVTGELTICATYITDPEVPSASTSFKVNVQSQYIIRVEAGTGARTKYPRGVYTEPDLSGYRIKLFNAKTNELLENKTLKDACGDDTSKHLSIGQVDIEWVNDLNTQFRNLQTGSHSFRAVCGEDCSNTISVSICDFSIEEVIPYSGDFVAGDSLDSLKNGGKIKIKYDGDDRVQTISLDDAKVNAVISSSDYNQNSLSLAMLGANKSFTVRCGKNADGGDCEINFTKEVKAKKISLENAPNRILLDTRERLLMQQSDLGKIKVYGSSSTGSEILIGELAIANANATNIRKNEANELVAKFEVIPDADEYVFTAQQTRLSKDGIYANKLKEIHLPNGMKTDYLLGETLQRREEQKIRVDYTSDSKDNFADVSLIDSRITFAILKANGNENTDAYNSDTPDGSASTDANAAKTLKKLGNHNVTVAYGGATASYNISVEAAGIEKVDGYEPKRKYLDGERINFSDMRIKVLGAGNTNFGTYRLNEQGIANLQSKLGGTLSLKERETVISDQTKLSVGQGSTRTAFISVCYGGKQISNPIAITIYRASDSISVQADRRGTAWYGKPNEVNAGSELAVKNNGYSGSSAYYSRKAYVQFDLSDCIKYASDNDLKIDSLTLSFKAKNNSKDPIQRKTKLFDVLGTWPTAQEGGVTVNKLTWNTAKSFTVGTWSSNVNIKEEKTFTLTIPKSLIRDKLILGMESVDKNGGDMQYIYADGTMKLKVNYALNKEVKEIKDITGYKDTYMRGSSIDKSQGSLRVVYTDDSSATMSFAQLEDEAFGYNFSPADSAADEATVRITYGGKTAEYTVELVENGVSEITGISDTEFKLGQQMKSSEVSLYVRYKDGSTGSIPMSDGRITIGRNGVGTYSASSIGTQEVTIYCSGLAQGYDASVNVEAVYIDWVQMPSKRSGYYVGEELDLTRGSIKAYGYSVSGSSRPESAALSLLKSDGALSDGISVSGDVLQSSNGKLVLKKAGTNTINIHYGGRTLSYSVTAEEPWVTEITGLAAYSGGEDCILLGDRRSDSSKCIYVKYADGSSGLLSLGSSRNATAANITITGCGADAGKSWNVGTSAANSLSSTVGVKHINISYSQPGHSIVQKNNYEISVAPVSLSLSSVKTDYVHNQEFDRTQGSITAIGINNVTQESIALTADGVTINGYDKTKIGTRLVTLGYMGKSASIQVTVAPKAVSEIRITKLPTAKYCEGQNSIDLTGGQIVRRYNDGTEDLTAIDMVDEDTNNVGVVSVKEKGEDGSWTLLEGSTYDMSAGNTYRITLAYAGKRAHYDVVADYNYSSFKLDVSGSKYTIKKSGSNTLSTDPGALAVKNNTNNTGANTRFSYMSFSLGNSAMGDLADILDDNRLGIKKVTLKLNARISGTLSGKKGDGDGDKTGRYVELYVKDTDHKASWSSWSNKPAIKNTLGSCRVRETGADYTEFSFDLTDYIKTRLSSAATDRSSFTLGLTAMQTNGASIAVDNTGAAAPQIIIETYEKELEPAANYTVAQEQNRCVEPNTLTVRSHVGTDVSKTAQSYISFSLNNPGSDMLKNELNAEDREIEKATLRFKAKLTSSLAAGDGSSDADGRFIWLFVRNVEQEGNEWQKWADRPAHKSNLHYSTHKVRTTSECEYEIDVTSCVKQRVQQSGSLGDTVTFALSASGTNTGGISILNSLTDGNKPELIIETKNKPNENK